MYSTGNYTQCFVIRTNNLKEDMCVCVCVCVWRKKRQPTPIVLPGEAQGQRSLVDYIPWGHKESEMTEACACTHTHTHI